MKVSLKTTVIIIVVCIHFGLSAASNPLEVVNPVCEYRINPIGIDIKIPRLSWQLLSQQQNVLQQAYEIRVADSPDNLESQPLWSSGKVMSQQSVLVAYAGPEVESAKRYYWQVRVWDNHQNLSAWSEPAFWEMGLLDNSLWQASWITKKEKIEPKKSLPVQYYRHEFKSSKEIARARVYATSLGIYELYINGKKVGDELFTPGFTSYSKRIQYQTYDVTNMLQANNTIGAMLGDGWYRGFLGWQGGKAYYGNQLALLAQLHIDYVDGTSEVIATNSNWKVSYGSILESDIYNGEIYDARIDMKGWANNGFNDKNWDKAIILDHSKDILVASNSVPVKAIQEIKPIEIIKTPKGELVMDLGQNFVGRVRLKVKGKKGDKVTMQFAEVLDKEGNFYTKNLRAAKATNVYILSGEGEEIYDPYFTFHGFRYVKLEGYPGKPTLDDITGIVIHSDMKHTGFFECSDPLINQLQSNIQWGQKSNFLDIPTDCPQRDERVGWTGDAQVFSQTAAFNFNVAPFFTKWLADLSLDQQPNGEVPNVIPDMWDNRMGGATGWGDAAVIVPWNMYLTYGDLRILEVQYPSMKAWVDYMAKKAGDNYIWNERGHWHWGDWLSYHSGRPDNSGAFTEKDLIATAYFKYSTELLGKTAALLGNADDASKYSDLAKKIRDAFVAEYVTPNGRLVSHTQTAYAMAISFDLIPINLVGKSGDHFAENVSRFGHLTTGFLGTPLLCPALSIIGRDDLAYKLLNRKEYPSWLYPVTMGATTIWERWDTQKPDGTIIEGMNSFNHYAYGAIGQWLYQHAAGLQINPLNPGYKHIIFAPHPGGGLTKAKASLNTMYGVAESEWRIENNTFYYKVTIPANTTATVYLPNKNNPAILLNNEPLKLNSEKANEKQKVELGSGIYYFEHSIVN